MTNRVPRDLAHYFVATRGGARTGTTMTTPRRSISLVPPTRYSRDPRRASDEISFPLFFFLSFSRPGSGARAASDGHHRQRCATSCARATRSVRRTLAIYDRAGPSHAVVVVGRQRARGSQLGSAFARLYGCRHLGPPSRRPAPVPSRPP